MKILSKCVTVSKSMEEVNKILCSSASPLFKPSFCSNQFSIRVVRKDSWRGFFVIPIKGNISESVGNTRVTMAIHAEATTVISAILVLLGLVGLLRCLVCLS